MYQRLCGVPAFLVGLTFGVGVSDVAHAQTTEAAPAGSPAEQQGAFDVNETDVALSSPDIPTRVRAVRSLGQQQGAAAVPRLIVVLRHDPVPEVRGWTVRTLHELSTPEATAAIQEAARQDPDQRVRNMAAQLAGVSPAPLGQPFAEAPPPPAPPPPVLPPVPRVPGRGLRVGGWVTTGVTYGLALLVGLAVLTSNGESGEYDSFDEIDFGWKMLLPIVGPVVASTTNDFDEAAIPFWFWAAGEAAGVVLLAVGYYKRNRWLREHPEGAVSTARRSSPLWALAPGGPQGSAGFNVIGAF